MGKDLHSAVSAVTLQNISPAANLILKSVSLDPLTSPQPSPSRSNRRTRRSRHTCNTPGQYACINVCSNTSINVRTYQPASWDASAYWTAVLQTFGFSE